MRNLQNFAKNLRKIRLEKELSQENIALELGMSREAYRKLENGKTNLNITHLEGLSNVFKMDLADMMNHDNEKYNIINPQKNLSVVNNGTIENPNITDKQQIML